MQLNLDFSEPLPKKPKKKAIVEEIPEPKVEPVRPKAAKLAKTVSEFGGAFEEENENKSDSESSSSSSSSDSDSEESDDSQVQKLEPALQKDETEDSANSRPCRYFAIGKCLKGANCTFLHDNQIPADLISKKTCTEVPNQNVISLSSSPMEVESTEKRQEETRNDTGERFVRKVGQRGKLSVTFQTFSRDENANETDDLIVEPIGKRKREEDEDPSRKRKKLNKTLEEVVAKYESMVEKTRVAVVDTENNGVGDGDSWESFGFAGRLRSQLLKMGFEQPTNVQQKSIPIILNKKDVLMQAATGEGKTLAYLLPIIHLLQQKRLQRSDGCKCLIILPVRELCLQVYSVVKEVLKAYNWIVPGEITGGEKRKAEKKRLRKGVTVLCATPGRLRDHLLNTINFPVSLRFLVLDEADRLLDIGFERDIKEILTMLKKRSERDRQNILVSATLSGTVETLAGLALKNPVTIGFDKKDEVRQFVIPSTLSHFVINVKRSLRLVTLIGFLRKQCRNKKTVLFVSTCNEVEYLTSLFQGLEMPLDASKKLLPQTFLELRGDMDHKKRVAAHAAFCKAETAVLICTDVAARGLDLPSVDWIVQYVPPTDVQTYIHRTGRTARAGKKGQAVLFLDKTEVSFVALLKTHEITMKSADVVDLLDNLKPLVLGPRQKRLPKPASSLIQEFIETHVDGNPVLNSMGILAFQSFVRSYAIYPKAVKYIFHVKNLHLGYVAKSFGLKSQPSTFSHQQAKAAEQIWVRRSAGVKSYKHRKHNNMSEFAM